VSDILLTTLRSLSLKSGLSSNNLLAIFSF